jgi:hypothetical protein
MKTMITWKKRLLLTASFPALITTNRLMELPIAA